MSEENGIKPMRPHRRTALADTAAITALAVVAIGFFWKIGLTNQVLTGVDLFAYFYPYRDFASESLRHGHLPLWNPYLFMGAPLLANSQVAVLYPLHWPLLWLSAPKQIAWSMILHIWLAGTGTYVYARSVMRLRPSASLAGSALFAFGGFLGAQVEHINQLNASAWMPWLFVCLEAASRQSTRPRRSLAVLGGGAVVSLIFLAGHTQAAYIVLVAAGCYSLFRGIQEEPRPGWRRVIRWLKGPGLLAAMALLALLLSAGQILPTIELSRLSVRSGGLDYREAVSFSLKPTQIPKALLPPLAWEPPFSEYVAYVGICGLLLAGLGIAWLVMARRRDTRNLASAGTDSGNTRSFAWAFLGLALLGMFLALGAYNPLYYILYKLVPGIALFRAPARWMLLYAFGTAIVAAVGFQRLAHVAAARKMPRSAAPVTLLLILVELFLWGSKLAYNHPSAPAASESMRSATAHLLAGGGGELSRFLSLSDTLYDPGDLSDLETMFARDLPERALYDLVVASKMKEVLAYNLPLRYRLYSVDGYDGGLLPTSRYVTFEHLFLEDDEIWPDGRLRQQLSTIPPLRLLSPLSVRYIITDKLQDAWHEGVYYDLEIELPVGDIDLTDIPSFEATQLGIVTYLTETIDLPNGTPVAEIIVESADSPLLSTTLRAGYDTAVGLYNASTASHDRPLVVHNWRDNADGADYLAILDLPRPARPDRIRLRSLLPEGGRGRIVLRGVSLIDGRTGTSASVSIDPALRLVHSGDVKIYRNLAAFPRAFLVHEAMVSPSDDETIAQLQDGDFDPAQKVILAAAPPAAVDTRSAPPLADDSEVEILSYGAERIELRATLGSPGYLVLSDAHYPGWAAEVDGNPTPIVRANTYFRAVALGSGEHTITFLYRPASVRWGIGIGGVAWAAWALAIAVSVSAAGRSRRNRV